MRATRLRRRRSSGQGLVEFAIVGGLLFFLIFSVMNAGFYLYGTNAMQYAADIGVAAIAAEGNYDNTGIPQPNNADTVAIARMDSDGLTSTPLVRVTEVDVYKENVVAGVFSDATGCTAGVCENRYNADGTLYLGTTVQWSPGGAQRWTGARLRKAGHPFLLHAADRNHDLQQHDGQPLPPGAAAMMRLRETRSGQAMVEMALLLPVLLLLFLGAWTAANLIDDNNAAAQATRAGARLAAELGKSATA